MSNTKHRDKDLFPYRCHTCNISLSNSEVIIDEAGNTVCSPCVQHAERIAQIKRARVSAVRGQHPRRVEALASSLDNDPHRAVWYEPERTPSFAEFANAMPYAVLTDELAKHDLFIDDKFDKQTYTDQYGRVVAETDVLGTCHCRSDPWYCYVSSDGTINGWYAARAKVKEAHDKHVATRLVPAVAAHAKVVDMAAEAGDYREDLSNASQRMYSWRASTV